MGWRYYLFAMGGIMFVMFFLRFFVFKLYESPKYLMGRGRDEEAVRAVHLVAAYNGKTSSLRLEHLQEIDAALLSSPSVSQEDPEKIVARGLRHVCEGGRATNCREVQHGTCQVIVCDAKACTVYESSHLPLG